RPNSQVDEELRSENRPGIAVGLAPREGAPGPLELAPNRKFQFCWKQDLSICLDGQRKALPSAERKIWCFSTTTVISPETQDVGCGEGTSCRFSAAACFVSHFIFCCRYLDSYASIPLSMYSVPNFGIR